MKSERCLSKVIPVQHDLVAGMLAGVHEVAVGWQPMQAPAQPACLLHNIKRQMIVHLSDYLHHLEHAELTGKEVLYKELNRIARILACGSL